jgi:hypothetical protein
VNTIQKMAQKRALIAATLLAVNASEFFTQDLEEFASNSTPVVTSATTETDSRREAHAPSAVASAAAVVAPLAGPDADIRAACRALGKSEEQLVGWIRKKFGAESIGQLTESDKREVLSLLQGMLARRAA